MKDEGLQLYLLEISKHKARYKQELDELRDDLIADSFKTRDYRAAERLLQVFTELCIGLAKHWVKKLQGQSNSDSYQAFIILKEHNQINSATLSIWKKIIGMRNGLVHDYLNIDLLIVEGIIRDQHYLELDRFADQAIKELQENKLNPESYQS